MTTPLRRRLRLARRGALYALAAVLVLMALVNGVVSRLLPLAERHPDRVAAWLSERAGRPVAFDRLEAAWTRRGPLLRFDGLRIGAGEDAVRIGEAEMLVSQYAGLLPGRAFSELRLRGLQLTLEHAEDGRWQVRGLPGSERADADPFAVLERLGELQVIGGQLSVHAPAFGLDTTLPRIDLRLQVDGARVRAAARAWIDEDAQPLDLALDLDRHHGTGQAYAAALRADVAAWAPLLHFAGAGVESGHGRAQLWLQLQDNRIAQVTLDAALTDVGLRGASMPGQDLPPRLAFARVEAQARWRSSAAGWRLDAPHLRLGNGDAPQVLDGLVATGGAGFSLRAGQIDGGPLLALLALGDRFDPGLRRWLLGAAPEAEVRDLSIVRDERGRVRAQARLQALRFASLGDTPGLSGLAGTLSGDAQGFGFVPDPDAVVRFDWPSGFGAPHQVTLRGEIVGWREGDGLRVGTPALRVQGEGYAADMRGGVWFQNDGTRPALDLATALDEAEVPVARRFWVRHVMPDAAERWLDDALVGGRVREGRAVLRGDLDDWPFSAAAGGEYRGLFHARARLHQATVRFQQDWPALEEFDAVATFVNDGFRVQGNGTIAGVEVRDIEGSLDHYSRGLLEVRARPAGDAGEVLALLQRSPLRNGIEDTLDSLSAAGPLAATFALSLPLHGDGRAQPTVAGEVDLRGVTLGDARWKIELQQVRGLARYDRHGFRGDGLSAVREGRTSAVSLRAGRGHVRDAASVFEAELEAPLSAQELLQQAPRLAWLAPHIDGRSRWQVGVAVAQATRPGEAATTRLQLRSDLVGTTLDLPAPLRKPAAEPLPTTISATLPLEDAEVGVAMGSRLALRARATPAGTGVRVQLGASSLTEPPPVSGLVVGGQTPELDAMGWTALATAGGDDGQGDSGLPLRGIDVDVAELRLLGTGFPRTRMHVSQDAVATQVRFEGEALAGALQIPRGPHGAVSGRFERLHWQPASPLSAVQPAVAGNVAADASAPSTAQAPMAAARDEVDPSSVPALQLDVDDFRFGALALGRLELRTRSTAAGLEIERLQTRSPSQRLDASGTWTGRGASARTQLHVDADSRDFGELMAGLGFGGSIAGGDGRLGFEAEWPRSPADFSLGAIRGELSLAIKDGHLVEVEPGAGRVLGLLGVAQLPRRLMLDFRDFFSKGFAFDRIGGSVRFAAGTARSDDMAIDGPAAEIRMRGRSDLRAQTHDQTIEVHPRTGNLLPAVGAIAGGPVGAAVGAVANAMLKRPLGEMNARTYRVTGPWKDPKVEVVEVQSTPQAAAAPPARPSARAH